MGSDSDDYLIWLDSDPDNDSDKYSDKGLELVEGPLLPALPRAKRDNPANRASSRRISMRASHAPRLSVPRRLSCCCHGRLPCGSAAALATAGRLACRAPTRPRVMGARGAGGAVRSGGRRWGGPGGSGWRTGSRSPPFRAGSAGSSPARPAPPWSPLRGHGRRAGPGCGGRRRGRGSGLRVRQAGHGCVKAP